VLCQPLVRGCPGWPWDWASGAMQHLRHPLVSPRWVGRTVSLMGSWEVLALGCLCGFLLDFSTARRRAMGRAAPSALRSAGLSRRVLTGMSSETRAYHSCRQAGLMGQTPQWRNRNREAFAFLNKPGTSSSVTQVLASCTKILRLSDFQNVSVCYYSTARIRCPKATPRLWLAFSSNPS